MFTKLRSEMPRVGDGKQGFSFVELLIAIVLAAVLVLAIYSVFSAYRKTVIYQEDLVEVQQAGRGLLSRLRDDLIVIGRGVNTNEGQEMILHAGTWEFVFNGDLTEKGQLPVGQTFQYSGPDSPYTSVDWQSDAETIGYYMRTADPNDPRYITPPPPDEKDFSFSAYDWQLRRKINNASNEIMGFGIRYDDGSSFGSYPQSPGDPPQRNVMPLFSYWGDFDFDPSTADTLWGDLNNSGTLSDTEIQSLYDGGFTFSYDSAGGTVTVTPSDGAIYLISSSSNKEDKNNNGLLDSGEDVNRNGRLDRNVLGSVIHRVELNVTTIAQNPDQGYSHPREPGYNFRESWVHTAVTPRNLNKTEDRDCGGPPGPPSGVNATVDQCGGLIHITWTRSADDGGGDNDVLWYEVVRKVAPLVPGPTANWEPLAVVPATGVTTYGVEDYDTTINRSHVYRVQAVDCGDSRSAPSGETSPLTPTSGAPLPPSNVAAFDSPCYNDSILGSITLRWEASADPSITEYWVFRSEPEDLIAVNPYPIAKLPVADAGQPNTACAGGATSEFEAHVRCTSPTKFNYYKWGNTFVWRDEFTSYGRTAGSGTPLAGSQFDIGIDKRRYHYVVRAYDGNPSSSNYECLSNPAHLQSECGDHSEVQSFDNSFFGAGGSNPRSIFSPPQDVQVDDVSRIGWNGQLENPRIRVRWNASLDQWCGAGGGETPDWYLVYRNKLPNLDLLEPSGDFNFDTGHVVVFPGAQVTNFAQTSYLWYDDNELYKADNLHTPRYLNYGTADTRMGSVVSDNSALLYYTPWPASPEPGYDVIVSAGNLDGTWGFGASCMVPVNYDCYSSCTARVSDGSGYAEQHSMRGDEEPGIDGDDGVRVFWQFETAPPVDSIIDLEARVFPAGDWEVVQIDVPSSPGIPGTRNWNTTALFMAVHEYSLQDHGELYEYSLVISCPETGEVEGCKRRVLVGAEIGASVPGVPDWCMTPSASCPADAGRYCGDTDNGKLVFYVTDRLASPSDAGSQTDDRYLYFRIARWAKFPSDLIFPVEPQAEYMLRGGPQANPSGTLTPNGMLCPNNASYCYDHPSQYYPGATPPYQPRFDIFPGSFTADGTTPPVTSLRRFRFQEFLDPSFEYRYTVETRIGHDGNPPRDCCTSPPGCTSTCNGSPADAILVEFETDFPCYPYAYTGYCCAPVTDYEVDPFTGLNVGIGNQRAAPAHSGARSPWDNDMWPMARRSIYIAVDFPVFGTIVLIDWDYMQLGSFMTRYYNNEIRTDFNAFFGDWMWPFDLKIHVDFGWLGTFETPILYDGPIDRSMCGSCIIDWSLPWPIGDIDLFCALDFWSTCFEDVQDLHHAGYLVDNFAAGNCGATAGDPAITGDFMLQWHWRSEAKNRRLDMAFRNYYSTAPGSIRSWLLEADFSATNRVDFGIGYQYGILCEHEDKTQHGLSNDGYDTQWWSNLALICNKKGGNDPLGDGQMYVFWWSEPDTGKSRDLQEEMYSLAPRFAWHTINEDIGGLPYYNPATPALQAGLLTGRVGFWVDPYIDWTADNYYFDNVRIIEYCGACPPASLEHYLPSPYKKDDGSKAGLCWATWKRSESRTDEKRKAVIEKGLDKNDPGNGRSFRRVFRTEEEYLQRNKDRNRRVIRRIETDREKESEKIEDLED